MNVFEEFPEVEDKVEEQPKEQIENISLEDKKKDKDIVEEDNAEEKQIDELQQEFTSLFESFENVSKLNVDNLFPTN